MTTQVDWPGEHFNGMTARQVIGLALVGEDELTDPIKEFYGGKQWDPDNEARRWQKERPALVINKLPGIVAAIISNSHLTEEVVEPADLEKVIAIVTRRNMDAQRYYNYMHSVMIEQQTGTPKVIMHPDNISEQRDGITFVKPPRMLHGSWLVRLLDKITTWIDPKA